MKIRSCSQWVADGQSPSLETLSLRFGMVWLAVLALLPTARADVFNDDLCHGIDTAYWVVESNQPLYTVEATTGGVRFSRPAGGSYSFQYVTLESQVVAQGNFDVRVDYTNASISRIDGSPGNQVQLNSLFGGQYFIVVRSDEINYGQNIHVWANPPSAWFGQRACTDTFGTMRITRTNAHLRAYYNATLIYENDYNTNDASFAMPLQNNGTRDATAVTFANFQLAADHIVYPPPRLNIQRLPPQQVLISWPAYPSGYFLQRSPSLPGTGLWEADMTIPVLTGNRWFVTNAVEGAARFYRLKQEP